MDCGKIQRMLGLYLSGGLPEKRRRHVESHIASCPRCREEVRRYEAAYEILDRVEDIRPSEDFQRRLRSRLRRQYAEPAKAQPRRRAALIWTRRAVAAAACVVVLLSLWVLLHPDKPGSENGVLTAEEELEIIENLALLENLDILEAAENGDIGIYKGELFAVAEALAESNIDEPDIRTIVPPNGDAVSDDEGQG